MLNAGPATGRRLNGRNALVTGAGRGVGRGIALALAHEGCNVAVNYKDAQVQQEAQATADELKTLGVDAFPVLGDVQNSTSVQLMFDEVVRRFPRLDLLVNNAGVQVRKHLLDLSDEDWDSVIETNLKGCFLCTRAAGRLMRSQGGGAIVNIGSGCNKLAFPKLASYVASKGGIEMFTKAAAEDLGPFGIRVNCVAPGAIAVERTCREDPDYELSWGNLTPLGRIGHPEDVGRAVVFLAGQDADFITGQTLWVDGGVFSQAPWPS